MTGQRRIRGRLDDDRHDLPDPAPATGYVELEELSVARVVPRGRGRPGAVAVLAAGGLVLLLATGFGALGGKPSASQAAAVANASGTSSARPGPTVLGLAPGETPAVTPWTACSAPPSGVPGVLLEVNGSTRAGSIDVLRTSDGVIPPHIAIPFTDPVGVSTNLPAELWIEGGACANAWTIDYSTEHLDVVGNAGLNPLRVAQNRFSLFLAPFGGSSGKLTAELTFQTMTIGATWSITVDPYERPSGYLTSSAGSGGVVEGCATGLTLHDGWFSPDQGCSDDLVDLPEEFTPVEPAGELRFSLSDWTIDSASFACGTLDGHMFVADARAKCDDGDLAIDPHKGGGIPIPAPRSKGIWTLAIQACASTVDWLGHNQICGTWYANVQVEANSEG